jgi:hypothetical protein
VGGWSSGGEDEKSSGPSRFLCGLRLKSGEPTGECGGRGSDRSPLEAVGGQSPGGEDEKSSRLFAFLRDLRGKNRGNLLASAVEMAVMGEPFEAVGGRSSGGEDGKIYTFFVFLVVFGPAEVMEGAARTSRPLGRGLGKR